MDTNQSRNLVIDSVGSASGSEADTISCRNSGLHNISETEQETGIIVVNVIPTTKDA